MSKKRVGAKSVTKTFDCAAGIEEALVGVEPMVWSILSDYRNLRRHEREDIKQEVLVHIWIKCAAAFDPSKKTKFSSFVYRCAVNYVNSAMRSRRRRLAKTPVINCAFLKLTIDSGGRRHDVAAEMEGILAERGGMLPRELRIVDAMLDNPQLSQRELAKALGYRSPGGVSMALHRMRKRLRERGLDTALKAKMIEESSDCELEVLNG